MRRGRKATGLIRVHKMAELPEEERHARFFVVDISEEGTEMKKRSELFWILMVLSLMVVPVASIAREATLPEAQRVAENFLRGMIRLGGWGEEKDAFVLDGTEFIGDGRVLGYFFPVSPKGYILVSLLTQLPPLKAFSWENDLDITAEDGPTRLLKDTMGTTIEYLEKIYGSLDKVPEVGIAPESNEKQWDLHLGTGVPLLDTAEAGLFVVGGARVPIWNQNGPFNNSCPMGDGGRTLVGCVATAAAEIMGYWKYPYAGKGSYGYDWDGDDSCGGSTPRVWLSADFSDFYDWNNILWSYSGAHNAAQDAAVAELCYEVGVAFGMDYGHCGSGSNTQDAQYVFPDHFRYANTTGVSWRVSFATADEWFAEIRKEFDNYLPRPIQYRIYRAGWAGHSIVCEGYHRMGPELGGGMYLLMNYGWGGSGNLWYAVDNIYCPDSSHICPTNDQFMVVGIQPPNMRYIAIKGATNNRIYYGSWYDEPSDPGPGIFSEWNVFTGSSTHAPAMVVFKNRQYIVVKGATNNSIYINSKDSMGQWTGWTAISGQTSLTPAIVVFNDRLYFFVKGATNNNIYYRSMSDTGVWDPAWQTVPGFLTDDTPAPVVFQDRLWLFVKGLDNRIYYRALAYIELSTPRWEEASYVFSTGKISAAPAVVKYAGNAKPGLWLFVKGATNNNIYYAVSSPTDPTAWSSWQTLSGQTPTTPSLTVVHSTTPNELHVAVRGLEGGIYTRGYDGATWQNWTTTPGTTSDTPVLNTFYNPYYLYGGQ